MKKAVFIPLLVLLIYLSIFPRITEVLNKNYLFGFDQGRDYLAVQNIVKNNKLTLIGSEIGGGVAGFKGIFHGPFHYYFLAIPFFLFNGDPYGGILWLFGLGIATIVFGYYFGERFFGKFGGMLIAFLVAVSPPLTSQSRFVWNTNPSSLFILLAFYFVYKSKNVECKNLLLAAFFSAFVYNFQLGIAIPLSLTLLIFSILFLRIRRLKAYFYLFAGFLLGFLPMILFEVRHNFMMINGFFNYLVHHEETAVTMKFLELLLKDHFNVFIDNFLDTFPKQTLFHPMLIFLFIFVPFFYNLFLEKDSQKRKFLIYLIMLSVVTFFVFSFLRNLMYAYYLVSLNFVYIFFFAYAIYNSFTKKNFLLKASLSFIITVFLIQAIPYSMQNFLSDYNDYGGTAKIRGKIDAIDYIYKDAKNEKFGLLTFSPPIYTYPYDYLLLWYGQKTYGYIPYQEKKKLFYLLIEKDGSKPWTYKGWIETVIKSGRVIETKTLPSGFIVQKRYKTKNEK